MSTPSGRVSVKALAKMMTDDLLAQPEGAFLGVESDVLERYGASRPTLRQAARILEHQQLLTVKAGLGGGYFVARPSAADLISAAALYLRSRAFTLPESVVASQAITDTIVTSATAAVSGANRDALRAERDRYADLNPTTLTVRRFVSAEIDLNRAVTRLAGNGALELFQGVLYEFGAADANSKVFDDKPDRIARAWELRLAIVDAILAQDVEIARVLSLRHGQAIRDWMAADLDARAGRPRETVSSTGRRSRRRS